MFMSTRQYIADAHGIDVYKDIEEIERFEAVALHAQEYVFKLHERPGETDRIARLKLSLSGSHEIWQYRHKGTSMGFTEFVIAHALGEYNLWKQVLEV